MKTKLLINEVKLVGYTTFYCLMGHLIRAPPPPTPTPHTHTIKRYGYPIEGGGVKGDYRGLRETTHKSIRGEDEGLSILRD